MPRVRFHLWMIMVVISVAALLMALVRIIADDPMRLIDAVDFVFLFGPILIIYFAPFICLAIAFRLAFLRLFRTRATYVARDPDQSLGPAQFGDADKV